MVIQRLLKHVAVLQEPAAADNADRPTRCARREPELPRVPLSQSLSPDYEPYDEGDQQNYDDDFHCLSLWRWAWQGGDLGEKIQRSTWQGVYQSLWEPVRTRSGCGPPGVSAPRARAILGCGVLAAENIAGTIRARLLFAVLQTILPVNEIEKPDGQLLGRVNSKIIAIKELNCGERVAAEGKREKVDGP